MKPRRIFLFSIGIVLGCVMVYFTLIRGKNRGYWLPDNRIKDLILHSEIIYSPHAKCMMKCRRISEQNVLDILKNGEVNYEESDIHGSFCPTYAIEGGQGEDKKFRIIVTTVDSIAEIESAIDLNSAVDSCVCK